jgi:hypothetical protein
MGNSYSFSPILRTALTGSGLGSLGVTKSWSDNSITKIYIIKSAQTIQTIVREVNTNKMNERREEVRERVEEIRNATRERVEEIRNSTSQRVGSIRNSTIERIEDRMNRTDRSQNRGRSGGDSDD